MTNSRHIRVFDYVNHPYEKVRDALTTSAGPTLARATTRAAARAESVATQLHVTIGALEVATDIEIKVHNVAETPGSGRMSPVTRVMFEWKAKQSPRLFPLMHAELTVYPLTGSETQLDFSGQYDVPLGILGKGVDAVVGNRIADASIHRFVTEVAEHLREALRSQ
jgi:hypothetical protein